MSRTSCKFFDKEQAPVRDTRVGILILCILALLSVLIYRIPENNWISIAPEPTSHLAFRDGKLIFERVGMLRGVTKESFQKLPPGLAPFFFQPIPVNFADVKLIETINGIGPHLAQKIVETRDTHGFFASADDLMAVPGIGPKRIRQLENQLSFRTTP